MPTATTACYWLIGINNPKQTVVVAIDLYDANANLVAKTYTQSISRDKTGKQIAIAYAAEHGIDAANVFYDNDTTQVYAKD